MYNLLLNTEEFNQLAESANENNKTIKFYVLSCCLPKSRVVHLVETAISRASKQKSGYSFNFYSLFNRGERSIYNKEELKLAEQLFRDQVNNNFVPEIKEYMEYEGTIIFSKVD